MHQPGSFYLFPILCLLCLLVFHLRLVFTSLVATALLSFRFSVFVGGITCPWALLFVFLWLMVCLSVCLSVCHNFLKGEKLRYQDPIGALVYQMFLWRWTKSCCTTRSLPLASSSPRQRSSVTLTQAIQRLAAYLNSEPDSQDGRCENLVRLETYSLLL